MELYHAESEQIQKLLNCSNNFELLILKPFDEKVSRFSEKYSSDNMEEWIDTYSLPLFAELNQQNFDASLQQVNPLIILITQNEDNQITINIKNILYQKLSNT